MRAINIDPKTLPQHIRNLLPPAHTVNVVLTDRVALESIQWSEGSRNVYTLANLDDSTIVKPVTDSRPCPQSMFPIGETQIPPRFVIIKTGTFCGKEATPYIYARAEDVAPQIEKPDVELTHLESQVLYCLACYNSSGRKRFRDDFNISKSRWDSFVESLVDKGLATRRGAVTIEGKNRARKLDDLIVNPYSEKSKG